MHIIISLPRARDCHKLLEFVTVASTQFVLSKKNKTIACTHTYYDTNTHVKIPQAKLNIDLSAAEKNSMKQLKTKAHRFYAYIEHANFNGYEIEGE